MKITNIMRTCRSEYYNDILDKNSSKGYGYSGSSGNQLEIPVTLSNSLITVRP